MLVVVLTSHWIFNFEANLNKHIHHKFRTFSFEANLIHTLNTEFLIKNQDLKNQKISTKSG